ncbi:Membrane-associated phospholipid phosphatase (PgpB) (PDB:1D2T) [Commensalibacter communis]|uniref:acid phosphatase n=1 Tax=Commensalibacter communis TaxID=2972786 RepID=UPI0022FF5BD6|nr:phosphatase PAP2 family protein [Commensalibacter communis]CAI3955690.1 Membrane-associated phospholipid phosphatase (PgpB) (PDB:1D2T) [Commensalibacter communis]CAI3956455.1 Membrane-associated phospholipid phosphatase (PgpB) (PDB:1D2T) [Commensalibacter communis]
MIFNKITASLLAGSIILSIPTYIFARETQSVFQKKTNEPYTSYLKESDIVNSLALLPPPPEENSAAFLADQEAYKQASTLAHTPRWGVAQSDADLSNSNIGKPFSKALSVSISKENTPATYHLMRNIMVDSGFLGTEKAKKYYERVRPYVYYHTQTCSPQDDNILKHNGSYPSGHTAVGWSTALIFAEMFPQKQDEILQRGYDFGQSRVICGVHWQSDVDAGRIIGAAIVARLHANQKFMQDFQKSKNELIEKMK